MENGAIKIWLPAVRTGTGTDMFTRRLSDLLESHGFVTQITWFPLVYEILAPLLRFSKVPAGTDIVFTNSWNGFAFKRQNLPLVVTLHHGGFDPATAAYRNFAQRIYHRQLIRPYEKCSFKEANAITAVSRFAADSLRQHLNAVKNIHVIHNWIDTNLFLPTPDHPVKEARPFKLLFVGKLSRLKGAELLAPLMQSLGSKFELHVAGDVDANRREALPANIRLLGWLDQDALIHAYQNSDALICPSHSEGFSYAVLEAMACGKPVIASNVAALPELVRDGINGILCKNGSVEEFAAAAQILSADQEKCRAYGVASRLQSLEFSESSAMNNYLTLIKRLCNDDIRIRC